MQASINIKKDNIIDDLQQFKDEEYPELSNSQFFVRCAIELKKIKELMKREK